MITKKDVYEGVVGELYKIREHTGPSAEFPAGLTVREKFVIATNAKQAMEIFVVTQYSERYQVKRIEERCIIHLTDYTISVLLSDFESRMIGVEVTEVPCIGITK